MPPKKSARSASRGRTAAKSPASAKKSKKASASSKSPAPSTPKSAKKASAKKSAASTKKAAAAAVAAAPKMDFDEGDNIMARWPGTSLYFKAKVTYVRDEDNEYDVQYEDGTIFTIKAKDVKASRSVAAASSARKKTPSRSRSRGRSPGRKAKATPKSPATPKSSARSSSRGRRSAPVAAPKPDPTPVRTSTRLAAKKAELSDDEGTSKRKYVPNPAHPKRGKKGLFADLNLDWLQCLFFMVLGPAMMLSLHKLAQENVYSLRWPNLPKNLDFYWDKNSMLAVVGYLMSVRFLNLLPLGTTVRAVSGKEVRMNGFYTLLAMLAVVPAMIYRKMDVSFVAKNYFHLMTSAIAMSVFASLAAYVYSRWAKKTNLNPRGNTGNFFVDFYNGREFNPFLRGDLKLLTFRASFAAMAMINVMLVLHSINLNSGRTNPAVIVAAAFQVLYAMDALFFEEYYFFSHDAMNTGFGFSLISSYYGFPFLPTLITKYIVAANPVLPWYQIAGIALVNALGYVIFRSSETQRCEFIKNPNQPSLRNLRTVSTVGGKKILAGGWWSLVRHPNYLGELLMQWSWVMPAACVAGRADLLVYYLPVFTTLILLVRSREQNARNKRKYGNAWDTYASEVTANIVPKVY